jgi:hypothetical protein
LFFYCLFAAVVAVVAAEVFGEMEEVMVVEMAVEVVEGEAIN